MQKFNRGERQYQRRRVLKQRIRDHYWGIDQHYEPSPTQLGKLARNPKLCACWMCSNPRHVFKEKAFNERRAQQETSRRTFTEHIDLNHPITSNETK